MGGGKGIKPILNGIAKNPLIIAILSALPFGLLGIELPQLVITTGNYFANMTLPLALLCTGASLNLKALRGGAMLTGWATVNRLFCIPLLLVLGAWALGFSQQALGILFLISSTPTAAASYVMTRAMGGRQRTGRQHHSHHHAGLAHHHQPGRRSDELPGVDGVIHLVRLFHVLA
ncbi:AEC family transporter, partial [Escherichia coli]|uniref:AEC family transporter n=1 Tax=Escherichia coli TaxID=562 RepID=UPI003855EECC